ncbi:MAG TPA: hypothetical protein VGA77_08355 [Propylenella sp.]
MRRRRAPASVKALEELGRVRLSENFFMRDFLYSEVANLYGIANIPDDPDLAVETGKALCENLLEPLRKALGRISIRSAYRNREVARICNERGHNCARPDAEHANHIWDRRDAEGFCGAMATIVVHAFIPYYERTGHWEALAWWVHDRLPYSEMQFFPRYAAFNLGWREVPKRRISSYIPPRRGVLTKPGMANHEGAHDREYAAFLRSLRLA